MSEDGRYRICCVCSGNICRSPMAEAVLRRMVSEDGLDDMVTVDSAGTGDWHIGERADHRAMIALDRGGYTGFAHRARQFDPDWFTGRDLVLALDHGHLRTLRSWAPSGPDRAKIRLLRSFDPDFADAPQDGAGSALLDVPDPYYDGQGEFDEVLDMIERACRGVLGHARAALSDPAAEYPAG